MGTNVGQSMTTETIQSTTTTQQPTPGYRKMTKLYLSHDTTRKQWLSSVVVPCYTAAGYLIVSSWVYSSSELARVGRIVEDIKDSVVFIHWSGCNGAASAQKYYECGIAAYLRKAMIVVGDSRDDMQFYHTEMVKRCRGYKDVLGLILT